MATEELATAGGGTSLPLLLGLGAVVALVVVVLRYVQAGDKVRPVAATRGGGAGAPRGGKGPGTPSAALKAALDPPADAAYLANRLRPDASPLDILYAIATSPDTLTLTRRALARAADLRERKRAHLAEKETAVKEASLEDLVDGDDGGWAEDDEDDPAAKAARRAREEKEKEAKRLARATGKEVTDFDKVKLEGLDEGVLGQEWVRENLTKMGAWPPPALKTSVVKDQTFDLDGKQVGLLDHPCVVRNLIMTMGRLNAKQLNTHPELTAAGPKGLIDPTYFQSTAEYRQRVGQMLDAALRMACSLHSYRLASSILDAIVMFKIGLVDVEDEETLQWFRNLMTKQYGAAGVPVLAIEEKFLGVPTTEPVPEAGAASPAEKKEAEKNRIARQIMQTKQVTTTDDKMALEMRITRKHAEGFTKEKLAQCQRQGVPPQIALSTYRETWFILVRATKLNEDGTPAADWDGALGHAKTGFAHRAAFLREKGGSLHDMLEPATVKAFEEEYGSRERYVSNKIVVGWPFVISNVAQKTGRVKIHLPPPLEPGKYEFSVSIKSQDFIGVGQEFTLVVDVAKGEEKKKEEETENKKDK